MTLEVPIRKFDYDMWSYYLEITPEVAQTFINGDDRRVKCTLFEETIHSALMPKKDVFFIFLKKNVLIKNELQEGQMIKITLEKETSEYGIPLPHSFQELLYQDTEGSAYFHELTKGKQRSLIHIVSKVKNVDSQLAKGLAIMHHLKESKGKLDFKRLNELIKEYNNRK